MCAWLLCSWKQTKNGLWKDSFWLHAWGIFKCYYLLLILFEIQIILFLLCFLNYCSMKHSSNLHSYSLSFMEFILIIKYLCITISYSKTSIFMFIIYPILRRHCDPCSALSFGVVPRSSFSVCLVVIISWLIFSCIFI